MDSPLETFVPLQFKRKKGKLLVDERESAHDVRISSIRSGWRRLPRSPRPKAWT